MHFKSSFERDLNNIVSIKPRKQNELDLFKTIEQSESWCFLLECDAQMSVVVQQLISGHCKVLNVKIIFCSIAVLLYINLL